MWSVTNYISSTETFPCTTMPTKRANPSILLTEVSFACLSAWPKIGYGENCKWRMFRVDFDSVGFLKWKCSKLTFHTKVLSIRYLAPSTQEAPQDFKLLFIYCVFVCNIWRIAQQGNNFPDRGDLLLLVRKTCRKTFIWSLGVSFSTLSHFHGLIFSFSAFGGQVQKETPYGRFCMKNDKIFYLRNFHLWQYWHKAEHSMALLAQL